MRHKSLLGFGVLLLAMVALFWPLLTFSTVPFKADGRLHRSGAAPSNRTDWRSYGGTPGGGQYSSLAAVNRGNVDKLRVAWTYHTGDLPAPGADSVPGVVALEVTPILADSKLYGCSIQNRVFALDPVSGAEDWSIDLGRPTGAALHIHACRGVSYWEAETAKNPCDKRIFKGDSYGRLIAINAETGTLCKDFGKDGIVYLRKLDYAGPGPISISSPPAIYRDVVIVGCTLVDNWAAHWAHGIVRAFDARSGRELWHFDPIPLSMAHETGAGNVWSPMSVDTERGIIYLPTTSPSPDFFGAARKHDMPFVDALVALNARTGAPIWHYQIVHHDLFDYDLPTQPILLDLTRDGSVVPTVAEVTKSGLVYVFNRVTGMPLFPIDERPVPPSDVPGEAASPTEPVPRLPEPIARLTLKRTELFGLTLFDRAACRSMFDSLRYDGMFTPPSIKGSLLFPGPAGGANWSAAAFDPSRNLLVVRGMNIAMAIYLHPSGPKRSSANLFNGPMYGTPYTVSYRPFVSPLGVPCTPPPWGELTAIDLTSGKTVWRVPLGRVTVGPFRTPAAWGSPGLGGPVLTGAGLAFVGATLDPTLRAFDSDTGKELWEAQLPAAAIAAPMTYEIDGRQYIVVAAGGSQAIDAKLGDALVAFALPN
jgi:quinoprotein glucose dehydrogenase